MPQFQCHCADARPVGLVDEADDLRPFYPVLLDIEAEDAAGARVLFEKLYERLSGLSVTPKTESRK